MLSFGPGASTVAPEAGTVEGIVRLRIEKLVAGGEGMALHEGRAVFVPLALPGELVEARFVEERRDWARAFCRGVIEASPARVEAPCPVYGLCGGCDLQHLAYGEQLRAKVGIVREIWRRTAGFDPGELEVVAGEPFGYRNRMQLHICRSGALGLMRRDSAEAVEIPGCPVADPALQAWIAERALSPAVREELAPSLGGRDRFVVFGRGGKVWQEGRHSLVKTRVAGEEIVFDLGGFFQSNLGLLDRLVPALVRALAAEAPGEGPEAAGRAAGGFKGRTEVAADLYAGVGLFGHFLAPYFSRLVMVEENGAALAQARTNAAGPANEYHAASVEAWCRGSGARLAPEAVVVDPPRAGLSAGLRAWLGRRLVPRLAYVSCDAVTLARDAKELLGSGYSLESLTLYDFYPQTGHIESLALFSAPGGPP